jgi:hypothetical protein
MQDAVPRQDAAAIPACVYCETPMRPLLADRLDLQEPLTHFACERCGWEVVVPLE